MNKRPWHYWLIAIVALLWNSIGAVDYVMTQTQNAAYMESFNATQLAYFYNLPSWFVAVWAIAIWSAVLGSILLLMGRKLSATFFLVSLIGLIISNLFSFVFSNGYEVIGGQPLSLVFPTIIFIIAVSLVFYTRSLRIKGVLD